MWLETLVDYRHNWDWPDAVCMPKVPHQRCIATRTKCTALYQKIHMNKSSDNAELVEVSNFSNGSESIHWHSIQGNLIFGKMDWCNHVPPEIMIPLNKSPHFLWYCSTRSAEIQTHVAFILATNILAPILCYNNWTQLITWYSSH